MLPSYQKKAIAKAMSYSVPGVKAKLGSSTAIKQFQAIESQASKMHMYRGKSLAWGAGGRSMLLRDRLIASGMTPQEANTAVRINYFNHVKKGLHN